jgi:hypothetical protein
LWWTGPTEGLTRGGTNAAAVTLPVDVADTLAQLLGEAADAARTRDDDHVEALLNTVTTVTENKVPDPELKRQLRHGCRAVESTCGDEPLVAAEYCRAMRDLVAESSAASERE